MIHVTALNKAYNPGRSAEFQALTDVHWRVAEGELVCLMGASGSGKTTLLSIVGALIKPTSGDVIVHGQRIAKLPDLQASAYRASTIGFVFQTNNLFDELTVYENVTLPLIPLGLTQAQVDEKVRMALAQADIDHKSRQAAKDLSGGEKQRCAIARALANDARVILCDEPTANLDRAQSRKFMEILKALKALGKTIVVATHDPLFEGLTFVDRIDLIQDGRLGAS